jgi:hypothetical protein
MKTFNVTVEEVYTKTLTINANSEEEARKAAENMSYSNDYLMTPDDYMQDSFSVVNITN